MHETQIYTFAPAVRVTINKIENIKAEREREGEREVEREKRDTEKQITKNHSEIMQTGYNKPITIFVQKLLQ